MKQVIPAEAKTQHTAVVGKTGSGKTSTCKLIIEQAVAEHARVCILDPIKSDWWGLTSSADGKHAGLPFQILGGPHGHVSLHSGAGKAIGELVASGSVPLSILDMKEFEPGGQVRFFSDFAATLLRKMKGWTYLVMEEAHLFAPKERSGIGQENMSIHWSKTMATAGRSAGIRLIVATQRTQALHNAVLGSCDTLIAHRLTAPADQEPILKWLKANVDKETGEKVASSLSSLGTGEGWICSGEAKVFERRQFPRIKTYDNTATPTGDSREHRVKTAEVDQEKLRSLIGVAVKEAEANDPKVLRARIAELERAAKIGKVVPAVVQTIVDEKAIAAAVARERRTMAAEYKSVFVRVQGALSRLHKHADRLHAEAETYLAIGTEFEGAMLDARTLMDSTSNPPAIGAGQGSRGPMPGASTPTGKAASDSLRPPPAEARSMAWAPSSNGSLPRMHRKFLTVLAQWGAMAKGRLLLHAGYSSSGDTSTAFAALSAQGYMTSESGQVSITQAGADALGAYDPLPTGEELRAQTINSLSRMEGSLLKVWFEAYPQAMAKGDVLKAAGYSSSGDTSTAFARLNGRGFIVKNGTAYTASEEFFK